MLCRTSTLSRNPTLGIASALFFASGYAALLYQIAWQRAIFGWYGADLDSVSVIISIFMLGLGLGALLGGQLADHFRRYRVMVFCIAELMIGGFGMVSLQVIEYFGDVFSVHGIILRTIMAFSVLILPTCAMGATLPLLATELSDRMRNVGMATGLLYSTNTFGAACGAIVVGFVLLPIGGLDLAVNIAAGFNFLIGGFAYVLFRSCYEDYSARAG